MPAMDSLHLTRRQVLELGLAGAIPATIPATALAQDASPEPVTLPLDRIDETATSMFESFGIPNMAVTVVHGGEVVYARGFGTRSADDPTPTDSSTRFQLASCSKPLSSSVVAALVGNGSLTWDSRMEELLPGFQLSDSLVSQVVTVRDLYSHRSGLPDHVADEMELVGYDRQAIMDSLRLYPITGEFRQSYAYTNEGLTAAGEAAAWSAGLAFEDAADEFLFGPLGMTRSSFRQADWIGDPNHSPNHRRQPDGSWKVSDPQRQPDPQAPAGGASSTADDLGKWMVMQLAGGMYDGVQVVDQAALAETHTPQIAQGSSADPDVAMPGFYGLGWVINVASDGTPMLSHSGAFTNGVSTCVYLFPAHDLGVAALASVNPMGKPEALAVTIADIIMHGEARQDYVTLFDEAFKGMLGDQSTATPFDTPPTDPYPALDSGAYTGTYRHDVFGAATVTEEGGAFTIAIGPGPMAFPITHHDRDLFFIEANDEYWIRTGVAFTIGPDGRASSVDVQMLGSAAMDSLFERVPDEG